MYRKLNKYHRNKKLQIQILTLYNLFNNKNQINKLKRPNLQCLKINRVRLIKKHLHHRYSKNLNNLRPIKITLKKMFNNLINLIVKFKMNQKKRLNNQYIKIHLLLIHLLLFSLLLPLIIYNNKSRRYHNNLHLVCMTRLQIIVRLLWLQMHQHRMQSLLVQQTKIIN